MRETSYSRSIRRRNRAADSISIRSNCNLEEVHDDQSQDDDDVDYDKDSGRNDDEVKKGLMKLGALLPQTNGAF